MIIRHSKCGLLFIWILAAMHGNLIAANSMAHHPSPYLAMHAQDPVDWQVWGEAVLKQAREQNKLIYISVGYFSCHWCHVMQKQSYSDPDVAALLNQGYIPVKVDRELRPELDRRLIQFVEETRGSAGWPLNVFLTPEGYPALGFTYLPKSEFSDVLVQLRQQWQTRDDEIKLAAKDFYLEIQDEDAGLNESAMKNWSIQLLEDAFIEQAMSVADDLQGGFGETSKFPQIPQLLSLMRLIDPNRESHQEVENFIHLTLLAMTKYNLIDHLNGGFFRYTTDPDWQTPHYEKMLYDNAQMVLAYLQAEALWPMRGYREVAEDTLQFLQSHLLHADGGYSSSLSAVDENSQEGGAYLWTFDQLAAALSAADFKYLQNFWQLDPVDSAEHQFPARPLIGPSSKDSTRRNLEIRTQLQAIERPVMPVDDKRLASGNALMLQALVAATTLDQKYSRTATRLYNFMSDAFIDQGNLIRFAGNAGLAETTFEDYAYVSLAFYQYGRQFKNQSAVQLAARLANQAQQHFLIDGRWYLNRHSLVPADPGLWVIQDTVSPSALTAWLSVMLQLPDPDPETQREVGEILHRVSQSMVDTPYYYGSFIQLRSGLAIDEK